MQFHFWILRIEFESLVVFAFWRRSEIPNRIPDPLSSWFHQGRTSSRKLTNSSWAQHRATPRIPWGRPIVYLYLESMSIATLSPILRWSWGSMDVNFDKCDLGRTYFDTSICCLSLDQNDLVCRYFWNALTLAFPLGIGAILAVCINACHRIFYHAAFTDHARKDSWSLANI